MKLRIGFVTNSSSSSYIVIIKKDDYEKVAKDMHPVFQFVAERYLEKDIANLVDTQFVVLFGTVSNEAYGWATEDGIPKGDSFNEEQEAMVKRLVRDCHDRMCAEERIFDLFIETLVSNGAYYSNR